MSVEKEYERKVNNGLKDFFTNHPISISIAVGMVYLTNTVLGLNWIIALASGVIGFLISKKLDKN